MLPSLRKSWLRKFLSNKDVHTLILLVPDDKLGSAVADDSSTHDEDEESEDEESSYAQDAEEDECVDDHEADGEALSGDVEEGSDEEEGDDKASQGNPSGVGSAEWGTEAYWRPRIAGAMSFESGERLGQQLVQVSLLGVRLRYQRLGVGSRLCRTLLQGQATVRHPEAAIAWADSRAVSQAAEPLGAPSQNLPLLPSTAAGPLPSCLDAAALLHGPGSLRHVPTLACALCVSTCRLGYDGSYIFSVPMASLMTRS